MVELGKQPEGPPPAWIVECRLQQLGEEVAPGHRLQFEEVAEEAGLPPRERKAVEMRSAGEVQGDLAKFLPRLGHP